MCRRAIFADSVLPSSPSAKTKCKHCTTRNFCTKRPCRAGRCTGRSHWTTSPLCVTAQLYAQITPTPDSGSYPRPSSNNPGMDQSVGCWTHAPFHRTDGSGSICYRTTFSGITMGTELLLVCTHTLPGSSTLGTALKL